MVESAPAKPIPQATIKLQSAPAPAAARKPVVAVSEVPIDGKKETAEPAPKKVGSKPADLEEEEEEEVEPAGAIPLPFLLAAAALALIAFGIQLWTFLS